MPQPLEYEQAGYNSPDGLQIGRTATDRVGFYGRAPVARRTFSSAVHVSSAVVTSASFGTLQVAQLQEVINTLIGLGIYATA